MILLTGCNTLLGKTMLKRLIENGENVRCYDFYRPRDLPEGVEFVSGDLQGPRQLINACDGIDTIFHFFDITRRGKKNRRYMKKINIQGTKNLIYAAQKTGVKNFFFLSSYAVYGKSKALPTPADAAVKPVTAYGKDKLKIELFCREFIKKNSMNITIVRPALIMGPGVKDPVALLTLYMALGMDDANRIYMGHGGKNRFQLLHPEDAVDAFMKIYENPPAQGTVVNLGSDNVPTRSEEFEAAKKALNIDPPVSFIDPTKAWFLSFVFRPVGMTYFTRDFLFYLFQSSYLDCEESKSLLGWAPEKDNMAIVTETAKWYLENKM